MASSIQVVTRGVRRRLMLAYVAREAAWRVMLVMAAVLVWRIWPGLWALPWGLAGALVVHWIIRWRGPGELASAIEIDRQLELKELISSALLAQDGEGLAAAVREQAADRAGRIDPRQISAGPVGLRYWIASLLLGGLVAAIPAGDAVSDGDDLAITNGEPPAERATDENSAGARSAARPRARGPIGSAESDFASVMEMPAESTAGRPGETQASRSSTGSEGAGAGLATGGAQAPSSPETALAGTIEGSGDGEGRSGAGSASGKEGTIAGTGTLSGATATDDPSDSGGRGASPSDGPPPSIRAVPPRYRQLIRAYYDR